MFLLIPRKLFDQLAEVDDTLIVKNVYKYGPEAIMSPSVFFYGIIAPRDNKIVGFLWGGVNLLTNQLCFSYMSLDKKYQGHGILKQFKELAKFICETYKLSPTYLLYSLHPLIAERFGGRESKCKIMEFDSKELENSNVESSENTKPDDKSM